MDQVVAALQEHLGVCNDLLRLASQEAQALKSQSSFPGADIRQERKALLKRLESALTLLVRNRTLCCRSRNLDPARNPQIAELSRTAQDTIMRILVLDRENEQDLLRHGLLPPQALPAAQTTQTGYVAGLYQRHARS